MLTDDPVMAVLKGNLVIVLGPEPEPVELTVLEGDPIVLVMIFMLVPEPVEATVLEDDPIALVIIVVLTPELVSESVLEDDPVLIETVVVLPLELVPATVLEDDPVLIAAVVVLLVELVEAVKLVVNPMLPVTALGILLDPVEVIELEDDIILLVIVLVLLPKPVEEVKLGRVPVVLVAVFISSLEVIGNPVALAIVPIISLELVKTLVPASELVVLVAVFRLPPELVLKLDMGGVTRVPLVGGGLMINVTVLEVMIPVPDVELRDPVDEENKFVVLVVAESGLAFGVAEEPRALVRTEPDNEEIDCVGPAFSDDTEISMHSRPEHDCEAGVGDMLELDKYSVAVDAMEDACVARGDPVDCEESETLMHDNSEQVGEADV